MNKPNFDDETLMRFADGELDAETALAVERAIETDDAIAARVELFLQTGVAARDALRPLLAEPVPPALLSSVQRMVEDAKRGQPEPTPSIVPFPGRRRSAPSRMLLPIAASLAAVAAGLAGYWVGATGGPEPVLSAMLEAPEVRDALVSVPAGSEIPLAPDGSRFRAIATFRDVAGSVCREFEIDTPSRLTAISVACHDGGEWQTRLLVTAPPGDDSYAPASSTETLDAYLVASGATEPMAAAEESAALESVKALQQKAAE